MHDIRIVPGGEHQIVLLADVHGADVLELKVYAGALGILLPGGVILIAGEIGGQLGVDHHGNGEGGAVLGQRQGPFIGGKLRGGLGGGGFFGAFLRRIGLGCGGGSGCGGLLLPGYRRSSGGIGACIGSGAAAACHQGGQQRRGQQQGNNPFFHSHSSFLGYDPHRYCSGSGDKILWFLRDEFSGHICPKRTTR